MTDAREKLSSFNKAIAAAAAAHGELVMAFEALRRSDRAAAQRLQAEALRDDPFARLEAAGWVAVYGQGYLCERRPVVPMVPPTGTGDALELARKLVR